MNTAQGFLRDERLTHQIIRAFYTVYNKLGYGFLEAPYVRALELELQKLGLRVRREVPVRLYYDGQELMTYRLDMVVEDRVVVEAKATRDLHPSASRKLYNYLKATNLEVGLLFHFGPEPKFY